MKLFSETDAEMRAGANGLAEVSLRGYACNAPLAIPLAIPLALQARAALAASGMEQTITPVGPFIGVVERIFASGIHIGFTLLLAWQLWLVVLTVPVHSLTNLSLLTTGKRPMLLVEVIVAIVGTAHSSPGSPSSASCRRLTTNTNRPPQPCAGEGGSCQPCQPYQPRGTGARELLMGYLGSIPWACR